ncbi:hypothetical protein [Metabacillus rhizosphaerae]
MFILQNLLPFNVLSFWPVLLIIIGLYLLFAKSNDSSKDL